LHGLVGSAERQISNIKSIAHLLVSFLVDFWPTGPLYLRPTKPRSEARERRFSLLHAVRQLSDVIALGWA
jgi:hypothetical protein